MKKERQAWLFSPFSVAPCLRGMDKEERNLK